MKDEVKYMTIALEEAYKAYKKKEIPVGAVIVLNDKILSRAYNKKEMKNCALNHAEIIAIKKACKKRKNWRLANCTMFVTLEPCPMCASAIKQSRISKIVYLIDNKNLKNKEITYEILKTTDSNKPVEIVKLDENNMSVENIKMINEIFCLKRK